ncbi:hypothetical protein EXIGLDRAFT_729436 [Exidia glandulosa HHB12029]|uniref:Uncharacterized protein n=1 Tax=Exidia glandulosa HHB12029 TaxID=1314781 RepID=A0A165LJ56_EXIGL|nr:hypothetical protein EXIGLDRAFT_729436 [Exidia glandulosa HHB12029]
MNHKCGNARCCSSSSFVHRHPHSSSTAPNGNGSGKRSAPEDTTSGHALKRLRTDGVNTGTHLARTLSSSSPVPVSWSPSGAPSTSMSTSTASTSAPALIARAPVTRTVQIAFKTEPVTPARAIDLTNGDDADSDYAALYGPETNPASGPVKLEESDTDTDIASSRAASERVEADEAEHGDDDEEDEEEEDDEEDWALAGTPTPTPAPKTEEDEPPPTAVSNSNASFLSPPPTPVLEDVPPHASTSRNETPTPMAMEGTVPGLSLIGATLALKNEMTPEVVTPASILIAGAALPVPPTSESVPAASVSFDADLPIPGLSFSSTFAPKPSPSPKPTQEQEPADADDDWLAAVLPPDFVPEDTWAGYLSPPPQAQPEQSSPLSSIQHTSSPAPQQLGLDDVSSLSEQESWNGSESESESGSSEGEGTPSPQRGGDEEEEEVGVAEGFTIRSRAGERVQCGLCGRWLRALVASTGDHVARQCGRVPRPGKPPAARSMFMGKKRRKKSTTDAARLVRSELVKSQKRLESGKFAPSSNPSSSSIKDDTHDVVSDEWVESYSPERGAVRCRGCNKWVDVHVGEVVSAKKWSGRTGHKSLCPRIVREAKRLKELELYGANDDQPPAEVPPELLTDTRVRTIDGDQAQCDNCGVWTLFKNWEAHHLKCTDIKSRRTNRKRKKVKTSGVDLGLGLGGDELSDLTSGPDEYDDDQDDEDDRMPEELRLVPSSTSGVSQTPRSAWGLQHEKRDTVVVELPTLTTLVPRLPATSTNLVASTSKLQVQVSSAPPKKPVSTATSKSASSATAATLSELPADELRKLRDERKMLLTHDPDVRAVGDDNTVQCRGCESWIVLRENYNGAKKWYGAKGHKLCCPHNAERREKVSGEAQVAEVWFPQPFRIRRIRGEKLQCNGCGKWTGCGSWEKHLDDRCSFYTLPPTAPKLDSSESDSETFQHWLAAQQAQEDSPIDVDPTSPPEGSGSGEEDESQHDDDDDAGLSVSLLRSIAARKAELLQDPLVRAIGHDKVLCKLCGGWIKISANMNYAHQWEGPRGHRQRCMLRFPEIAASLTKSSAPSPLVISIKRSPTKSSAVPSSDPVEPEFRSSDVSDEGQEDDDDFEPEGDGASSSEPELDI